MVHFNTSSTESDSRRKLEVWQALNEKLSPTSPPNNNERAADS